MKTLNLDGAKVASILIILSLFLPYMSYDIGVNGEAVEVTGFEMIEGFFEIFDDISNSDPSLNAVLQEIDQLQEIPVRDDLDIPLRIYILLIGILMFCLSPVLFALSSIIGGYISRKHIPALPKNLGKIHLGFFIIMILMLLIGLDRIPKFLGIGVWLGGLSSIGYIIEIPVDNAVKSTTSVVNISLKRKRINDPNSDIKDSRYCMNCGSENSIANVVCKSCSVPLKYNRRLK